MQEKIWLSSPHLGREEIEFVNSAFDSNWIAPLGPNVNGFESDISEYLDGGEVAALSSGTAALHLALIQLGVSHGDHVLCQSFTFAASANPIAYVGAHPVFVDSERDTWNMDPDTLEEAIETLRSEGIHPKAMIVVHLYGMPAKMHEIQAVANKYDIPIIEDAAEALGSTYENRPCARFGEFGVLSFNGNKIITTSGGGALVSQSKDAIEQTRFLSTQARDDAPHYEHSHIGYNYRMSNILAGIGRGQMKVLQLRVEARRSVFEKYKSYFQDWNNSGFHIEFQEELSNSYSNRWLTCILIDPEKNNGLTREIVRLRMQNANIECRPLWKPMHLQPVFAGARMFENGTSDDLFAKGLCLPSGSNLTDEQWTRIVGVLDELKNEFV
ncbi:MAG: aminotransferase class I/II-fold pyridoxal phosphate-dependent enzyme [Flavobacteriia bacterium]|nr:aminotransferase class I/II-fold pyridoxal phosphate-dependent enzyme [Flavobacteriia bacterium]